MYVIHKNDQRWPTVKVSDLRKDTVKEAVSKLLGISVSEISACSIIEDSKINSNNQFTATINIYREDIESWVTLNSYNE